ncbi:hypothetical protein NA57DRAFT_62260 [Rhizodiscina lignyota]|uniref:Uncharacterized protein n=1 Tax=Rhizodiscina lignyota TaxID=1504668 RepID=A0A9P4I3Y0_9PEZI|nr:hypothetical protein NA57DRAFT_62260 [Rhizodiscina lignyota]
MECALRKRSRRSRGRVPAGAIGGPYGGRPEGAWHGGDRWTLTRWTQQGCGAGGRGGAASSGVLTGHVLIHVRWRVLGRLKRSAETGSQPPKIAHHRAPLTCRPCLLPQQRDRSACHLPAELEGAPLALSLAADPSAAARFIQPNNPNARCVGKERPEVARITRAEQREPPACRAISSHNPPSPSLSHSGIVRGYCSGYCPRLHASSSTSMPPPTESGSCMPAC